MFIISCITNFIVENSDDTQENINREVDIKLKDLRSIRYSIIIEMHEISNQDVFEDFVNMK